MHITRLGPDDDLAPVLALLRAAFASMAGRIDPPSSLTRMTAEDIASDAAGKELWVMRSNADGPPIACMILTVQPDHLYLGKLAVDASHRGHGLARRMLDHAAARARALNLPAVQLQTRVELAENHATFRACGFVETGRTAHPGYDRPTSVTFTRTV